MTAPMLFTTIKKHLIMTQLPLLALLATLLFATAPVRADSLIATVSTADYGGARTAAVNPVTNKIYVGGGVANN